MLSVSRLPAPVEAHDRLCQPDIQQRLAYAFAIAAAQDAEVAAEPATSATDDLDGAGHHGADQFGGLLAEVGLVSALRRHLSGVS